LPSGELLMNQVKSGEIARRIKATEKEIDQVVKDLKQENEAANEEIFLMLEEEVPVPGMAIDW